MSVSMEESNKTHRNPHKYCPRLMPHRQEGIKALRWTPLNSLSPKVGRLQGTGLTLALHIWITPEVLLALPAAPASEARHAMALPCELPETGIQPPQRGHHSPKVLTLPNPAPVATWTSLAEPEKGPLRSLSPAHLP